MLLLLNLCKTASAALWLLAANIKEIQKPSVAGIAPGHAGCCSLLLHIHNSRTSNYVVLSQKKSAAPFGAAHTKLQDPTLG